DYSYTFTAPSTAGSYEIKVNSTYNGVYGEANQTLTVTANSAPSITEINISPTSPSLSDSLDCNVTAIDDFNSSFTIEYWWYNNSVFHSGGNYTGYMNNTNTIIDTLGSGNTSSQEYWNCTVRAYDGSNYSAYYSSAYNFSNSAPSKVNLSYPAGNDSFFTNRTPKFNWTAAYDLEGDTLNYHIEVSLSEDMSSPLINETGVPNLYYEQSSELDFTTYFWRVRANDSQEFGDWSDIWNFTLRKSITITIVNDSIDFGLMELSETKNTTNNDPYPFVIRNDGNYWADLINISANQSLWSSVSLNTQYVRIKAANSSSEPNSFDASSSETEWINLTANNQSIVSQLNYSDSVDEAEIEMLITVPPAEAPGEKQVSVLFVWEEAPT
ncbi:hypothetical protein JW930_05705, partial [Candidatus Woesearchaeota archaeon]|nr:hypothetical protein [Candidatus Woesearchaeota archaeon]